MKQKNGFVEYILELLEPLGDIQVKRIFGGVILHLGNKQLGIIISDVLYFKIVDSQLQDQYKTAGSKQFSYTRKDKAKRIVIKNWWSVPAEAMDDRDKIIQLAKEALGS